jgi:K+-transporting ATPase ATPase A chain
MTANGWFQILFFLAVIAAITPPLGAYITRVFARERTWLDVVLRPIERLIYRTTGVDETREMRWTEYAVALLLFSAVSMLVLYGMQRLQAVLPWNPQRLPGVPSDLAFNTAASFTTNTNWQAYSGESTMSYFTQMAGLAYHNVVSAAVGIAVAIAFIRGIARKEQHSIGNFWVDLVRGTLWILLPICFVVAFVLISQGVVQNLKPYDSVQTVEGAKQVIAQGPVASQEAIKPPARGAERDEPAQPRVRDPVNKKLIETVKQNGSMGIGRPGFSRRAAGDSLRIGPRPAHFTCGR